MLFKGEVIMWCTDESMPYSEIFKAHGKNFWITSKRMFRQSENMLNSKNGTQQYYQIARPFSARTPPIRLTPD